MIPAFVADRPDMIYVPLLGSYVEMCRTHGEMTLTMRLATVPEEVCVVLRDGARCLDALIWWTPSDGDEAPLPYRLLGWQLQGEMLTLRCHVGIRA